jgi:superfamily II DNA or RNA helicase
MKLLEMGRKPLMLFREHKHGEILLNMIPPDVRVKYVTGKLSKEERDEIRDSFKAGEVDLIIASTVYDQGVDLPALDALVLAGGGKSTAKALQRIGRVIRSYHEGNKKDAIIVETFDQAHYVRVHSMARYGIYKTEPRFLIKHGDEMGRILAKSSKWS